MFWTSVSRIDNKRYIRTRFLVLDALLAVGFNRIGIADTFIHVDSDLDKSQNVIWTY